MLFIESLEADFFHFEFSICLFLLVNLNLIGYHPIQIDQFVCLFCFCVNSWCCVDLDKLCFRLYSLICDTCSFGSLLPAQTIALFLVLKFVKEINSWWQKWCWATEQLFSLLKSVPWEELEQDMNDQCPIKKNKQQDKNKKTLKFQDTNAW